MTEAFNPIEGFPGYEVSTWGRVKGPRKILKPLYNSHKDTWHVCLHRGEKQHTRSIHRLVLEAFVGPCPEGFEGCHNDGDRANNRLDNLRWDTHGNNEGDKELHGTRSRGDSHAGSILDEMKVIEIKRLLRQGEPLKLIAARFGVGRTTIGHINRNHTWVHVPWPGE